MLHSLRSSRSSIGQKGQNNSCSHCVTSNMKLDHLQKTNVSLQKTNVDLSKEIDWLRRQNSILLAELERKSSISIGLQTTPSAQYDKCLNTDICISDAADCNKSVKPFTYHEVGAFKYLDTAKLELETEFTHNFTSRDVAYYGDYPYNYHGGAHPPCPISSHPYLATVLEAVLDRHPFLEFNSAMITRYSNGSQGIPYHADDEPSIKLGSSICTISLGETRSLKFRCTTDSSKPDTSVTLAHGDMIIMSQASQKLYEHSIPKDFSKNVRISITLRMITPTTCTDTSSPISCPPHQNTSMGSSMIAELQTNLGSADQSHPKSSNMSEPVPSQLGPDIDVKPCTVYISSSMFAQLKEQRLSSDLQDAHVFAYSGATATAIHERFRSDPRAEKLKSSSNVNQIILMCGTNNVDHILGSPKHLRERLLLKGGADMKVMEDTYKDIEDLISYLHEWAPNAQIRLVNVLPRESRIRNKVIFSINKFFADLENRHVFIKRMSTEENRHLFADSFGFRKSTYFSTKGDDNVHLNEKGVIRLANHLKYVAHQLTNIR